MQRKYKYVTICMLFTIAVLSIVSGIKVLNMSSTKDEDDGEYFEVPPLSTDEPVANNAMTIVRPYNNKNVTIAIDYYEADSENSDKAIIVAGETYMPNVGVVYSSKDVFDVLCILDGKVTEVGKNDIIGNYVKITHSDNLVSLYQIIDDIKVKKGDSIKQGDKIGVSSTSSIYNGNLLLFEVLLDGKNVNPEKYYNKTIKEI